jgi:hypothetical protein
MQNNSFLDKEVYQPNIDKLRANGYNPIAVSNLMLEIVYIFETTKEAHKAYHQFERDVDGNWIGEIAGWWYGKNYFDIKEENYKIEFDSIFSTIYLIL